jgi:hypothetical protein
VVPCDDNGSFDVVLNLKATDCQFENTYVQYKVFYRVESWREGMHAKLKYIYNVNKPSEFTYDRSLDTFSGDEF